jgi:hypothetical protein
MASGFRRWFGKRRTHSQDAPEFVGAPENRSESDNGAYVAFVERAVRDYATFETFKAHPAYQAILEHVTKEQGAGYLDEIARLAPDLIDRIEEFKANDRIGGGTVHDYPRVGRIGPTTLRYVKVAADLRRHFGPTPGHAIAEIGVGYGGQMLVFDRLFAYGSYDLFDLPPVLALASKYLESHLLKGAYTTSTLNRCRGDAVYDLAISNYAFSELPAGLQRRYAEKILAKARRGYLTMNSGRPDSAFPHNHLSMDELRALLPPFEVFDEVPSTAANNYIIVWGHRDAAR